MRRESFYIKKFFLFLVEERPGKSISGGFREGEDMGSKQQIEINFDAGLVAHYGSLIECIRGVTHSAGRQIGVIAADLDKSPSDFSREMAENPNDNRFLKVHDLEKLIEACGEKGKDIVYYLVEKYLDAPEAKQERASAMLIEILPLVQTLAEQAGLKKG